MMTNLEVAEYLDKYVMSVAPYGKWKEVVERAIKALEAQELNCDGCVYQEVADRFVDPCIRCKRNCIDYWKGEEE